MREWMTWIGSAILAMVMCSTAVQAFTPEIFNTGTNASHQVLPDLSPDPHYVATPGGGGVVDSSISVTPAANTTSAWIRPTSNFGPGTYLFTTTFTMPAAEYIEISGQWAAVAAGVDITLNGTTVNAPTPNPGNTQWHAFSISGNTLAGANTLSFRAYEDSGTVGLRVEILSIVPEPGMASLAICGAGLMIRRGSRQRGCDHSSHSWSTA